MCALYLRDMSSSHAPSGLQGLYTLSQPSLQFTAATSDGASIDVYRYTHIHIDIRINKKGVFKQRAHGR